MKAGQYIGYGFGLIFVVVCAILTAQMHKDSDPAPQEPETPGPPMFGRALGPMGGSFDPEAYFRSRDTDGDGRLSREESAAGWATDDPQRTEYRTRMFAAADTDGDGY